MATTKDLIGLGLPPFLAGALALRDNTGTAFAGVTATGSSFATGLVIAGGPCVTYISAQTGSGYVSLQAPANTSPAGPNLNDMYVIVNASGGSVTITAPSTMTIIGAGSSTAGNTGVSLANNTIAIFFPVTPTIWGYK